MAKRAVVIRNEVDGTKRRHEVEVRRWRATAGERTTIIEGAESWFEARTKARMELKTENVELEEIADDG